MSDLEVKQTLQFKAKMSANDPKRTLVAKGTFRPAAAFSVLNEGALFARRIF
jgi:hypothetical protein